MIHGLLALCTKGSWLPVWLLHWAARRHGARVAIGVCAVLAVGLVSVGYVATRWRESLPPEERARLDAARSEHEAEDARDRARRAAERETAQARRAAEDAVAARARAEAEAREERERRCTKDATTAFLMSQEFVKQRLKAPSTAKFPWSPRSSGVSVSAKTGCTYEVIAYVDSQNAFGAMLRARYVAEVAPTEDAWELRSLRFLE